MWQGREQTYDLEEADFVLFDDRTITKRELSVDRLEHSGQNLASMLLSKGSIKVVGRAQGRSILLWTPEAATEAATEKVDDSVSLRMALSELAGGNDFRLARWRDAEWKRADWRGHRIVLASRSVEDFEGLVGGRSGDEKIIEFQASSDPRPWNVVELKGEELSRLLEGDSREGLGIWIGCGMLPKFMDVGRYGR